MGTTGGYRAREIEDGKCHARCEGGRRACGPADIARPAMPKEGRENRRSGLTCQRHQVDDVNGVAD